MNIVGLSGNLTRDPETRASQGGMQILTFGLAVNDRRRNPQTGEWEDMPNFFDCVVFGNRAEALSRILTKGMHVALQGKLRWSSWERDGQKRSKVEVIVDDIDLPPARQGGGAYQQRTSAPQMPAAAPQMPQNAPQMPQGYANPPQQQMAPQMAPQAPAAYGGYQPAMQPQQQQPQQPMDIYSEDIPF